MRPSCFTSRACRYVIEAIHQHNKRYGAPPRDPSSYSPEASMALVIDVERAISSLPEGERTVLALTVIDGHTCAAAGAIMGIPTRKAISWRSQAIERLEAALAGY